jgi:hypothetical protein
VRLRLLALCLPLAACGKPAPATPEPGPITATSSVPAPIAYPPVEPRAPGTPGGFPDDRTPLSEAPFTPTSAQGAADVMQHYYALIGQKRYAEAWRLWGPSGQDAQAFEGSFGDKLEYHGLVGSPGEIEGAAGSLFVTVPVQVYGRLRDGRELHQLGKATLRRVNDVPGSTAEQRAWHIERIDLKTQP